MAGPAGNPPGPARLRVRMYNVGFGDCFLLTFEYPQALADGRAVRHVLVDFGSTSAPLRGPTASDIAAQLKTDSGGGAIDAVVVTHRHRDHLSSFGTAAIGSTLMADGYPKLVVRSWTERPDAAADATADPAAARGAGLAAALQTATDFAGTLAQALADTSRRSLAGELRTLAEHQLPNAAAVDQLAAWAAGNGEYLHYGQPSRLADLLPGVTVHVLGPPTVEQHPAVAGQASDDPDEFWMIYRGLVDGLPVGPGAAPALGTAPAQAPIGPPGPIRWLTDRMQRQSLNSLLRIVRTLDAVLNNTSVILLFEVPTAGGPPRRLLFGGDAQIENWEYALKFAPECDANLDRLRAVDLYKVGHHGSRNATPRTLFNLWNEAGTKNRPMWALMSTKPGVHGDSEATKVPRATLVEALCTRATLYSTQDLAAESAFVELVADLATPGAPVFTETTGAVPVNAGGADHADTG